jgi:hypothetical protein
MNNNPVLLPLLLLPCRLLLTLLSWQMLLLQQLTFRH